MISANRANPANLAYVGAAVHKPRDSDTWNTPARYVDAAREVLGGITLDPFSNATANKSINAKRFYTIDDDALSRDWTGGDKVWMNPPYSGGLVLKAATKLVEQIKAKNVKEAVVLVNNATETRFFQLLLDNCSSVCFTNHRIAFESPDGKSVSGNTRGQAFFYFGRKTAVFRKNFGQFGKILRVCK